MFSKSYSAALLGIEAAIIEVEADVNDGLPIFNMVGYLSSEVKEAKERVRVALKNEGYPFPAKRITVNLSPADVRKEGTAYDLAIAVSLLAAFGRIPEHELSDSVLLGELSLDGMVKKVNGVLPIVYAAREAGFQRCFVPVENANEGAVVEGIEVIAIQSLREFIPIINGMVRKKKTCIDVKRLFQKRLEKDAGNDFSDVSGQEAVKRAIEVSVAGMHNILLVGSPGSGKTMLAKRISGILPELSMEESIEITKIYSVCGLLGKGEALITERPFRTIHHSTTTTALVGGGRSAKPGEISLASGGVLFLDELTEFTKNTLEMLRQPLEERKININRLHANYQYPCNTILVAAMNPCNCGYYPDRNRCRCSESQIHRYLNKISRPLLDRIDLCVETESVDYEKLSEQPPSEPSRSIRDRVRAAREIQKSRYMDEPYFYNAQLEPSSIKKYCRLCVEDKELLEEAFVKLNLSARAYHRILKVARTIADLDGCDGIMRRHLSEAICYRSFDKKIWGRG